jgi:hypothetical protein
MLRSDDSGFYDVTACCKWGVPLYLNAAGKVGRWLSSKLGQCSGLPVYDTSTTMSPSAGESNSLRRPNGSSERNWVLYRPTCCSAGSSGDAVTPDNASSVTVLLYQLDAATGDRYLGLSVAAASCMDCVA